MYGLLLYNCDLHIYKAIMIAFGILQTRLCTVYLDEMHYFFVLFCLTFSSCWLIRERQRKINIRRKGGTQLKNEW